MCWGDGEIVEGVGLSLGMHAERLASQLRLTPEQTRVLVAELRDALVPACRAVPQMGTPPNVEPRRTVDRGLERALALIDALVERLRVPSADPYE